MLKRIAVGAAAGVMLVGSVAYATEKDETDGLFENIPGKFSANVVITSDYVFRGISQTGAAPALQGGFDWAHSIATDALPLNLSLGVWGSNVDFADSDNASIELDYYGSVGTVYKGVGLDANFIYYDYPGANDDLNYEFYEFGPSVSYDFGLAAVKAAFAYSPDFFGAVGKAYYYAADVTVPLPYEFALTGHVGYQDYERSANSEYAEWKIALSREVLGFNLSAAYTDTDLEKSECAGTDGCDARAVFTISRSF